MKTAVYLNFELNAKEVIESYKSIFNAEVICEYIFTDKMVANRKMIGKIYHAELKIGDLDLYICDTGQIPAFPSIKFVLEIPDKKEADKYFERVVESGEKISDFTKIPFGPIIAEAKDKFGIIWDIVVC